jgi:hypothetical protein
MSLNAAAVSKPTVVDFSTAATAKHRSADTDTAHPDAALIKACINFAVAVRAAPSKPTQPTTMISPVRWTSSC